MSNKEVCILVLKKYLKEIEENCYIPISNEEIKDYLSSKGLSKENFFYILKNSGVDVIMKNQHEAAEGYSNYNVNYLIVKQSTKTVYFLRNSPGRTDKDSLQSGKYNSKIFISLIKLYFSSGFDYNNYLNLYRDLKNIIKEQP